MLRASCCFLLVVLIAGCRLADREGMNPLPENAAPLAFEEMVNRARGQSSAALDAFYVDAWLDLEQAGQRLEQTARLLPKTTNIPDNMKSKIEAESDLLRQDAAKLIDAAKAKNGPQTSEVMQRINQRIRQLRPQVKTEEKK